jgi:trans-aconitate 2-methyltransferase
MWDPRQYDQFADERSRPFRELVARIPSVPAKPVRAKATETAVAHKATIVDLGCGTGQLTAELLWRWPTASVVGVDNSGPMLDAAARYASAQLQFVAGDIASWTPTGPVDVIVTNAALQWVPDHLSLLPKFVEWLSPGGVLALQVPANLEDPHHEAIRSLRSKPQWTSLLASLTDRPAVSDGSLVYADTLATLGCAVDAWETSYVHILHGDDPVLEWVKGTTLRPVLGTLNPTDGERFNRELAPLLRAAYPPRPWGTPFPFRRAFAVAVVPLK